MKIEYCGEEVEDCDSFDGDDPRLPGLVSTESFERRFHPARFGRVVFR